MTHNALAGLHAKSDVQRWNGSPVIACLATHAGRSRNLDEWFPLRAGAVLVETTRANAMTARAVEVEDQC